MILRVWFFTLRCLLYFLQDFGWVIKIERIYYIVHYFLRRCFFQFSIFNRKYLIKLEFLKMCYFHATFTVFSRILHKNYSQLYFKLLKNHFFHLFLHFKRYSLRFLYFNSNNLLPTRYATEVHVRQLSEN